MIKLKQVSKTFDTKSGNLHAVKDVNLEIQDGEIFGIIGFSGAGKSTLVRCINLLERPTQGRVLIDEVDLMDLDEKKLREVRKKIGMIFQHFNLMAQKTARQNVAFALRHSNLSAAEKESKVTELLELVGLTDRAENYPSQLSGGQKQRVAIARALANDPKILISDEATSALDPKTTKQILALLQDLNKKLGLTVVMITHEMQIVKDICNRVAVMQEGSLIEEGSVLDIFSNPREDLTKDFIKTATGIEEALIKIKQQEIVKNLPANAALVQLKYAGKTTDEPILNNLYKKYQVTANILYGNIEILEKTPVGEMIVILEGAATNIEQALNDLTHSDLTVMVLKRGV